LCSELKSKRTLKIANTINGLKKSTLSFFILLTVFFAGQSTFALSNPLDKNSDLNTELCSSFSNHIPNSPFHAFFTPFDSKSNAVAEENVLIEENEDESSESDTYSFVSESFKFSIVKSSASNREAAIQNRQKLSLYILHHCWKSFLI
jgi:hypothetical protein